MKHRFIAAAAHEAQSAAFATTTTHRLRLLVEWGTLATFESSGENKSRWPRIQRA
jgi:hypothetical protein